MNEVKKSAEYIKELLIFINSEKLNQNIISIINSIMKQ